MLPRWDAFSKWVIPRRSVILPRWEVFEPLKEKARGLLQAEVGDLPKLIHAWDNKLASYGGDSSKSEWVTFRPLRVGREEDWSDWLGFLIETSKTGVLAARMFGRTHGALTSKVCREAVAGDYRADLLIYWENGGVAHLEVKIDDPNLEKTFAASDAFEAEFGNCGEWRNFILMKESARSRWSTITRSVPRGKVSDIVWGDVAVGLRQALWRGGETVGWNAWAYAFLGAIEEKILALGRFEETLENGTGLSRLFLLKQRRDLFAEGMRDGSRERNIPH